MKRIIGIIISLVAIFPAYVVLEAFFKLHGGAILGDASTNVISAGFALLIPIIVIIYNIIFHYKDIKTETIECEGEL